VLQRELWKDILRIAHNNLQRDDAASMANSVEVRVPYLDLDFLKYAMNIPPHYKVKKLNSGYVRKHILRLMARALGVPEEICDIPKTAVQFGSGSMRAIRLIARNETFEKASSSNDGYSYEQAYIDALASKVGIPKSESDFIKG
jgi:asparagine synthase (glutamine-hydrolysing)